MKLIRKKGLDKIRIQHNRELFWSIIFLIAVLVVICVYINQEKKIGGERDEHGCLGPAGYSYNATIDRCVREWERPDTEYFCSIESRTSDMCTFLWDPVCAFNSQKEIIETKSNGCVACQDESVEYYINGECE